MSNLKRRICQRLENTYCRLGLSKIEGIGVFAIRDIPKNIDIFFGIAKQRCCHFKIIELAKLDQAILKMIDDFSRVEAEDVFIPEYGLNGMDISYYLNHSNRPNVKTINGGSAFITNRKVKKGEELTASYNSYEKIDQRQLLKFKKIKKAKN